ncbi:MAG: hypothetical protein RMA76_27880 [Deltaproteobacteria bacterium]
MADAVNKSPNAVADFLGGFVGEAPEGSSAARIAGDIAGALVPGLGEVKGAKDIFAGVRDGDAGRLIGGIIQLIPVAGAVGKAGTTASKVGTKAGVKVGEKVAAEAAEQTFSATAARLWSASSRALTDQLSDPKTRKKLEKAAVDAGQLALTRLVGHVTAMGEQGQTPDVVAREHGSFVDARKAAESGMGAKPDKSWFDLWVDDAQGQPEVVGRHQLGTNEESRRGMRFVAPQDGEDNVHVMWWNQPENGEPKFGIEKAPASAAEFDAIMKAYDNRRRSFRR